MKKRLLSLLMAIALLVTVLLPALPVAEAAKITKQRSIAIVFDNSGSMYAEGGGYPDPNYRWCRATYAMEVFAAMMNEEDTLYIYPMNPISVDGTTYTSYRPLVIEGPEGSEQIRRIQTIDDPNTGTPVQSIKDAHEGLAALSGDEKYLIVLTDGDVFHWYDSSSISVTSDAFSKELAKYSEGVEQMFLAIDGNPDRLPEARNKEHQYIKAAASADILSVLTEMCNRIFGRAELPVSGKDVSFDVSMSKVIVLIQGKEITGVTLSGGTKSSERSMQYCNAGGRYPGASVDTELQGVLVTYENLDAGTYQLTYNGEADSVAVYFEPDVNMQVQLLDEAGNVVDPNNAYAGTYKLTYTMVDKYGNPTDSELLRGINFAMTYTINGKEYPHTDTKNGFVDITLKVGDKLDGNFQVTYLEDYTIQADMGWPAGGILALDKPVGNTTLQVTGGSTNYLLSQLEQNAQYQVQVLCEGQPVTGKDLDRVELKAEVQGGNALVETKQTEEGFTLQLKYNGKASETQCGDQSLLITAVYSNRDGKPGNTAQATCNFHIEDDSQALLMNLQLEQDYYVISDLETSAPIYANLTIGGEPLTAEQFAAATVTVTIDGLTYDVQPDAANSRYVITLKGGENIETGDYTVVCHVKGINGLGKPAEADASAEIELQHYPLWMIILFWILVALTLITLIWLYMNAKVLPKDIRVAPGGTFNVEGDMIPGQIICNYTGKGKKRGNLRIQSPQCMSNPLAKCGFSLELEAISPRRTRSAARSVKVRGIFPMNAATTQNLQVGTCMLIKDPISEKLVKAGGKPGAPIEVRIGNNANTMVMAEVMDMNDGNTISCTLTARLKFF